MEDRGVPFADCLSDGSGFFPQATLATWWSNHFYAARSGRLSGSQSSSWNAFVGSMVLGPSSFEGGSSGLSIPPKWLQTFTQEPATSEQRRQQALYLRERKGSCPSFHLPPNSSSYFKSSHFNSIYTKQKSSLCFPAQPFRHHTHWCACFWTWRTGYMCFS